ncbi:MAG: hypothetical protein ACYC8T_32100 [Myxococcaceae bacterium]
MKIWTLLALLVSTAAPAQEVVKVFSDKGSFFLRAPKKHPLGMGEEVTMVTDAQGAKPVGTAIVMEVTGALVRISLDEESTKAGARFARLPVAAAAKPRPATEVAVAAKPADKPPALPPLKGRLENGPIRVTLNNEGDVAWTGCELRFDDGSHYDLGELAAHTEDTVMKIKFKSPPGPLDDHVVVRCDEGETKFVFANPQSPGDLKGYVENTGGGRVIVHNTSDVAWNRCDVRKVDRSHYVMGSLKARDHETIGSRNFKKEDEPSTAATELSLRCKEGMLKVDLK